MPSVHVSHRIAAPPEVVFAVCTDFERAAERLPAVVRIELLSPPPVGVGTRWRETRVLFGREATEEMTISQFERPTRYVAEAESCGTHYTTEFRFLPEPTAQGEQTRVEVTFTGRPLTWMSRLMMPLAGLMAGTIRRCLDDDLAALAPVAEAQAGANADAD